MITILKVLEELQTIHYFFSLVLLSGLLLGLGLRVIVGVGCLLLVGLTAGDMLPVGSKVIPHEPAELFRAGKALPLGLDYDLLGLLAFDVLYKILF